MATTAAVVGRRRSLARLSRALRRRRSSQAINGTVGAVLVALGGRLALAAH